MADGQDQEKTERATPKKKEEAREKGQIAQSREIPSVMVLLSALSVFYFAGGWMFNQLGHGMQGVCGGKHASQCQFQFGLGGLDGRIRNDRCLAGDAE